MSRFGMANVAALVNIQEELAAKRMEALAARLGLAPEEAHIDVRRTAGGRCFGLLKFIVDIGFGIRKSRPPTFPDRVQPARPTRRARSTEDILAAAPTPPRTSSPAWTPSSHQGL
jgi:hypothetical protein